jgi:hypothetical protein
MVKRRSIYFINACPAEILKFQEKRFIVEINQFNSLKKRCVEIDAPYTATALFEAQKNFRAFR